MSRCRKKRYPDRITALIVLSKIAVKGQRNAKRQESRAYECPRCHGWHLTSTPLITRKAEHA